MYNRLNKKIYSYIICKNIFIVTLCMSIIIILLSGRLADNYRIISILPMVYTICTGIIIMANPMFIFNLFKIIIIVLYGIRMFILPLLILIIGEPNYNNNIASNVLMSIDKSVFLQSYEFLIVSIFLTFNNKGDYLQSNKDLDVISDLKLTQKARKIIWILILLLCIILIRYPALLSKFRPIVFINESEYIKWKIYNAQVNSNMPKLIYYISTWLLSTLRIAISYLILIYLKKKSEKSKNPKKYIIASLIVISSWFLIVTEDKAGNFYCAAAMLILLMKLYANKRKYIKRNIINICLIVLLVFIITLINKSEPGLAERYILKINAYFSGTINIAAASTMPRENLIEYFIGDTLRSIPIVKGLFTDMNMSYILFNKCLAYDTIYNSQIIPCIGQGYFYFGYIGAPIFSVILVTLGLKSYSKLKTVKDTFGYYTYSSTMIFICVGIIAYDFFLTFSLTAQYCLPIWVLYKLFTKSDKKENL